MGVFVQKRNHPQKTLSSSFARFKSNTVKPSPGYGEHRATQMQQDIDEQAVQSMSQAQAGGGEGRVTPLMSPRFGHDFSQVQVHANPKAADRPGNRRGFFQSMRRDRVFGPVLSSPHITREQPLLADNLAEDRATTRFFWNPSFFIQGQVPPPRSDPVHTFLLDQYSRDTGLPRDTVTAHESGYEAWLLGRAPTNVILDMPVPAIPAPDYSRDESQLGAWEKANFLFSPRLSFICDHAMNHGRESSFVTDIGVEFTQSTFEYFIARHIYENMNNRGLDVRTTWIRIHARVRQHAVEHFARYRQVVDLARQTIMQRFAALPTRSNPIGIPQAALETYVGDLLSYLIATLRFQLWQTTCNWEHVDYPNLLRGIPVHGRFLPVCDPRPSVPPEPQLPIIVTP